MKKFFGATLLAIAAMTMVACGSQPAAKKRCTAHEDGYTGYFITGDSALAVDGKKAIKTWDFGGDSFELKETTLENVKALDAGVGAALEAKGAALKKVYSLSGVSVGLEELGWSQKFKQDDKIMRANASYCLKIIKTTYSMEDDVWGETKWNPDPHTSHVENLKNYWSPTFQEEADADGFAWDQNPVVTGGAGIYTVVFAEYNAAPDLATCNFGCAFIRTEEKQGVAYTEVKDWVASDHTYGLIGSFDGHSWDGDVAQLTGENNGPYKCVYQIPAETQFKVRADGKWDDSWGYDAVTVGADLLSGKPGDNMIMKASGTYEISITFVDGNAQISIATVN